MVELAWLSDSQLRYFSTRFVTKCHFSRVLRVWALVRAVLILLFRKPDRVLVGNVSVLEAEIIGSVAVFQKVDVAVVTDYFLANVDMVVGYCNRFDVRKVYVIQNRTLCRDLSSFGLKVVHLNGRRSVQRLESSVIVSIKPIAQYDIRDFLTVLAFYKGVFGYGKIYITFHPRVGRLERSIVLFLLRARMTVVVICADEFDYSGCRFVGFYSNFMLENNTGNSISLIKFKHCAAYTRFIQIWEQGR